MDLRGVLVVLISTLAVGKVCSSTDVEILLVFDQFAWDAWEEAAAGVGNTVYDELYSLIYEASLVMSRDLGVNLRVSDVGAVMFSINILSAALVDEDNGDYDVELALTLFKENVDLYLSDIEFDAAIMITGLRLFAYSGGQATRIHGIAYWGAICTEYSVAIVEEYYTYSLAATFYHEIGHLLGAVHDGVGNDCPAEDGYIMNSYPNAWDYHFFNYSSCSKDEINAVLSTEQAACLLSNSASVAAPDDLRFGRITDGDENCRRVYGPDYFVADYYLESTGYDVCELMVCINEHGGNGYVATTPQGLPCAPYMSCNFGECTDDPTVPGDVDPDCLFGDMPNVNQLNRRYDTCEDVVAANDCNINSAGGMACCASCAEL